MCSVHAHVYVYAHGGQRITLGVPLQETSAMFVETSTLSLSLSAAGTWLGE